MKRILSLLLCVLLLTGVFCSCTKEPQTDETEREQQETTAVEQEETPKYVTLGYYSHDSLNPFKTKSKTNCNISTLLFDSLFKNDNAFEPTGEIAGAYRYEDKTLTVSLSQEDIRFTDGTAVSPSDVVYSFKQAKDAPLYKERLSNFISCHPDADGVTFLLAKEDIFAAACLDFPVVKYATADEEIPTGSGRYILESKKGDLILLKNENYSLPEELEQNEIHLYDINETETQLYLLQIGGLSFVYDDFTGESADYKIKASTADIHLTNLVFLAFNSGREPESNIKRAVALSMDKAGLCAGAFDSHALPCSTVFHPQWYAAAPLQAQPQQQDVLAAAQYLEDSGYVFAYETNEYRSKDFEYLKSELLVCNEDEKKLTLASEIARNLRKLGFDITLTACDFDEYGKRLENGEYDMYIGEIKLTANMDLSPFFSENGGAGYGIDKDSTAAQAYYDFAAGKIDISTFTQVFDEYLPFIPICYRTACAYYSRKIQYENTVSEGDIFANIYSWG